MGTLSKSDSDTHNAPEYCAKKKALFGIMALGVGLFAFCFVGSLLSSDPLAEKINNASGFMFSILLFLVCFFFLLDYSVSLSQDGISIGKWFRVKKVTWDEVESVEIFAKREVVLKLSGRKKVTIVLDFLPRSDVFIERLKTKIPVRNIITLPDFRIIIEYPHYISMCSMLLMMVLMFLPGRNIILTGLLYGNILGVCLFYHARWVLSHWESLNRKSSPVKKRIKYLFAKIVLLVVFIGGLLVMTQFRKEVSLWLCALKFFSGMLSTCFGILFLVRKQLQELWAAVSLPDEKDQS